MPEANALPVVRAKVGLQVVRLHWHVLRNPSLLIALLFAAAVLVPSADGRAPAKKLIEFGWDEPSTKFLRENIAEMEKMPFDGVVFNVHYKNAAGADSVIEWTGFGPPAITWESLQPSLADLRATKFHRFTDNFLRFNTT